MTQIIELHASDIELIKTNRSLGHYMLLSALPAALPGHFSDSVLIRIGNARKFVRIPRFF